MRDPRFPFDIMKREHDFQIEYYAERVEKNRNQPAKVQSAFHNNCRYLSLETCIRTYSLGEDIANMSEWLVRSITHLQGIIENIPENNMRLSETDHSEFTWQISLAHLLGLKSSTEQMGDLERALSPLSRDVFLQVLAGQEEIHSDGLYLPNMYQGAYDALHSDTPEQALEHLKKHMKSWYPKRQACLWYGYHKFTDEGARYYGYWAFEAAAIAYLKGVDDRELRESPYYPADMVDYARARGIT